MENIINFISNIDNSTYNKIRHSKSDAECRRYLKEQLTKQLTLTDIGSMFSAKQMEQAYNDGVEAEQQRCGEFDIENYC